MIALRASDTYMNFRRHNPEDSHLDIHSPGNFKCHIVCGCVLLISLQEEEKRERNTDSCPDCPLTEWLTTQHGCSRLDRYE
jgi:hypothetical protein